jgi:phenylalanyl-tRNA synthetase beta chain
MKFTLSWLKDHIDTASTLDEIVETLTRIGLEVESVTDKAKALAPYVVARIISAEQHPNADRLRVCMVDDGSASPIQVVCGAPNAVTGLISVFAPPGTYIPGKDMTLGKGVIRGVESNGMLCSAAELELSDESDGIIELPGDAPVGMAYAAYAKLDDAVIEINLTPNRADCTSIAGIARDLAAAGLGKLKTGVVRQITGTFPCSTGVVLDLNENGSHLAHVFGLRLVRGVRNGPSPEWLQRRLKAIGLRPINILVDITNYLTFDRGRPLHVFDLAKVHGNLVVRRARDGESLTALDGKTYALDESMVVISDDNGVESLAGIMGGMASGCDETTTDVLVESALWDALNIARTGRKLGISSDARYRFERGVDPDFCLSGLELATQMILDLAGGEASHRVVAGEVPDTGRIIDFPWTEVKRLTGLDIPVPESRVILTSLGFHVSGSGERVKISPPSWRGDVEGKADLVEEIVRIAGLDRIKSIPLPRLTSTVSGPVLTLIQKRTRLAKRALAARGLVEAVTWSFIGHDEAVLFGGGGKSLQLSNPIASDLSDMRPSLLPQLIKAAQRNADKGLTDVALFEVGQVFVNDEPEGQMIKAASVRRGTARPEGSGRHWDGGNRNVSVFDAKADAMALLSTLGVSVGGLQIVPGGPAYLHPGRSITLQFGPRAIVGHIGELHPKALAALDVKGPLVVMEIVLDILPAPKVRATKMKPKLVLSDFQPLMRDFAFVVDKTVAAGDILKAAQGADKALITDASVFDVYEGAGITADKKSIAVTVTLQPMEKTLTEAEIEAVSAKIIAEVAKKTGATLRG